jgi:hypothetical protein
MISAKLGKIFTFDLSVGGQIGLLRACFQGQAASLCQFLSTSDQPDLNDKQKRDFRAKLGQILTFDLSVRGQIGKF